MDFLRFIRKPAPLRPIVNTIGGHSYLLAKYLARKLKLLVGKSSSFVKDSFSFVNELNDVRFKLEDFMVSFDIVSLYANIPIKEAIDVINRIPDPGTTKLVEICLTLTFFSFESDCYEQTCEVAMGSLLSPVVANLFMEDFESRALASARFKPVDFW